MLEGRVNIAAATNKAGCVRVRRGTGPGKVLQPSVRHSVSTSLPKPGKRERPNPANASVSFNTESLANSLTTSFER